MTSSPYFTQLNALTNVTWENALTNDSEKKCNVYIYLATAKVCFSLFYVTILLFGFSANILALYISCKSERKSNPTTLYLKNLAVSDALFTLSLPGRISYYILEFHWPFGDYACRLTAFIFYVNTYVGIYFMTVISIDRYIAVVHSQQYSKFRRVENVRYICCFIWGLVFCQMVPLLLKPMVMPNGDKVTCMEYFNLDTIPNLPILLLFVCVINYCIPIIIIAVCYLHVNWKLSKAAKENPIINEKGHNKRAIIVICIILIAFLICFTPYHINIIQFMFKELMYSPSCEEQQAFKMSLQITVSLMNLNCCIDPVIYFFAFKGYKAKVIYLFKTHISSHLSSTGKTSSEPSSNRQTSC
ncbi:G-protein coupled receptor 183-like [Protopterus annectens]|uniref:G-protein coupled receptor 183-like n=1 Tax=Protopterus annectens TaxID=7888 RepID=UPI001CF95AA4|nr:G-protein coupled receptor 183-like [Protopterus annectens]XP_043927158.1 G-protein coupled receptor 183-like [Protopterus annectens]